MKKTTVVFELRIAKAGNANAHFRGSTTLCWKRSAPANDPGGAGWGEQSII